MNLILYIIHVKHNFKINIPIYLSKFAKKEVFKDFFLDYFCGRYARENLYERCIVY